MLGSPAHIKDVDGYIFFSPRTQGFTGRPVKIHTGLFLDFLCAVDPSTATGQAVIRDIEGLRATAHNNGSTAPIKPMGGRNDSKAHRDRLDKAYSAIARLQHQRNMMRENSLITKNVRIYYHIHQKAFDQYPTVYISEVQIRHEAVDSGGFYEQKSGIAGRPAKMVNHKLDDKTVFISAASRQIDEAMKAAKAATKIAKPVLFFTPLNVAEDLTVWKANRLTNSTQRLISELQTAVRDNQKSKVNWVVEGEGAALLSHALEKIPGSLAAHSFTFTNPRANLPKLLQALGERNAQLDGDFIRFNPSAGNAAFGSALAIASQKQTILNQLTALPASQSKIPEMGLANQILRVNLLSKIASVGNSSSVKTLVALPQALRGNKKTFVEALQAVRST